MSLHVQVNFTYQFDDVNLGGFAVLNELVRALQGLGVTPSLQVSGIDSGPPGAPAAPARRSKPKPVATGNGQGMQSGPAAPPAPSLTAPVELDPDDEEDEELVAEGGLSPVEARARGLLLVRQIYNLGFKREVKVLQQQFGVAKFSDVPPDKGHDFFRLVTELAERTGVQV